MELFTALGDAQPSKEGFVTRLASHHTQSPETVLFANARVRVLLSSQDRGGSFGLMEFVDLAERWWS